VDPVTLKRFDAPDELRSFEKGTFALVQLGGMTLGQATYEPGRKWSTHVGAATGETMCQVTHVGMVVSGRAAVAMEDGTVYELGPGDVFDCARTRQLGHRGRAVCVAPLPRGRGLCPLTERASVFDALAVRRTIPWESRGSSLWDR
jgi:hypothetical protein